MLLIDYNDVYINFWSKGQLLNAITNGNLSMVKQMVEFGLNVNYIYDREQNYSFLHLACLMGHSKVIK